MILFNIDWLFYLNLHLSSFYVLWLCHNQKSSIFATPRKLRALGIPPYLCPSFVLSNKNGTVTTESAPLSGENYQLHISNAFKRSIIWHINEKKRLQSKYRTRYFIIGSNELRFYTPTSSLLVERIINYMSQRLSSNESLKYHQKEMFAK